jgi:hypothetical protein
VKGKPGKKFTLIDASATYKVEDGIIKIAEQFGTHRVAEWMFDPTNNPALRQALVELGWSPPERQTNPLLEGFERGISFIKGYEYALGVANEVAVSLKGEPEDAAKIIGALHEKRP